MSDAITAMVKEVEGSGSRSYCARDWMTARSASGRASDEDKTAILTNSKCWWSSQEALLDMLGSRMEQVANALVTEAMMDGKLQMLAKNLFDSVVDYIEKLLPRRDPPASPSI
ncbi:uncharacterized protein IUM83_08509 [Phytophthora cinnamomi]|uniref:uncharacterized protein n=1 Tax=Phytophthora cinnamomi TaxID=4785 RepID=UPI003559CA41|nr:hypothetical protein IUM83_08509 [Phytophthora cinnamomi]